MQPAKEQSMRAASGWPLYGKYSWIEQGTTVRIIGVTAEFSRDGDGELTASFEKAKGETATVLATWRGHGGQRWVEIKYDPPNFGTTSKLASELKPIGDPDE